MEIKRRGQKWACNGDIMIFRYLLDIVKKEKKIKKEQRYSHKKCRAKERVKRRFKDKDIRMT